MASKIWQAAESSNLKWHEAWDSAESLPRRAMGLATSEDLSVVEWRPRPHPCPTSGPTESFVGTPPTMGTRETPDTAPQAHGLSAVEVASAFVVASATGRSLTHLVDAFVDAFLAPPMVRAVPGTAATRSEKSSAI